MILITFPLFFRNEWEVVWMNNFSFKQALKRYEKTANELWFDS